MPHRPFKLAFLLAVLASAGGCDVVPAFVAPTEGQSGQNENVSQTGNDLGNDGSAGNATPGMEWGVHNWDEREWQ